MTSHNDVHKMCLSYLLCCSNVMQEVFVFCEGTFSTVFDVVVVVVAKSIVFFLQLRCILEGQNSKSQFAIWPSPWHRVR